MTNKTLRSLAKEYANGDIDKRTYRQARNELLQGILSGRIPVIKQEYRAPVEEQDMDITLEKTAIQPYQQERKSETAPPVNNVPESTPQLSRKFSKFQLILVSAIIITICLIIIIIMVFTKPAHQNRNIGIAERTQVITPIQKKNPAQEYIEKFLAQKDWSNTHLHDFIATWNNFGDTERSMALSSPVSSQLANAIYKQILEEQALYKLGENDASIIKQHSLVKFANDIGIRDSRLHVQDNEENTATTEDKNLPEASEKKNNPVNIEPDLQDSSAITPVPYKQNENTQYSAKTDAKTGTTNYTGSISHQYNLNKHTCEPVLANNRQPYCRDSIDNIGNAPTLVVLPAGKFIMGGEKPYELPEHEVVISEPFAIAVNEISQGDFELFCIDTRIQCPPQPWTNKEYPVVNITWNDATNYTDWLSKKTGNVYRLPTEAEWEYAARANTTTKFPFGDELLISDAVFSDSKTLNSPLPRTNRTVNRNGFRLFHMAGNVREWVLDTWSDNYNNTPVDGSPFFNPASKSHVVRGGSYADNADALRSGARTRLAGETADAYTGFRVVQELVM